jgi:hypothetical protein
MLDPAMLSTRISVKISYQRQVCGWPALLLAQKSNSTHAVILSRVRDVSPDALQSVGRQSDAQPTGSQVEGSGKADCEAQEPDDFLMRLLRTRGDPIVHDDPGQITRSRPEQDDQVGYPSGHEDVSLRGAMPSHPPGDALAVQMNERLDRDDKGKDVVRFGRQVGTA